MAKGQAPVPITGYRWTQQSVPTLQPKPSSIGAHPTWQIIKFSFSRLFVSSSIQKILGLPVIDRSQ